MTTRHFLSIDDLDAHELSTVVSSAARIKQDASSVAGALAGKQIALIFEKPSTRTRVSFEAAVEQMGGHAIVLRSDELQLGRGETIEDTGRVLSRYVDCICVRTFAHDRLETLAGAATVPVVNALSDFSHPCQALADMQTIFEHRAVHDEIALAYLGDGNNVAHSLMFAGTKLGFDVRIAAPADHAPDLGVVERCRQLAADSGGSLTVTEDVAEAAARADVLYTDVWTSMGREAEAEERRRTFARFQVNADVVDLAADDAIVMHCLPAHRGEEITGEVIDGPHSVVWDQAENRVHAQKALLAWLLG